MVTASQALSSIPTVLRDPLIEEYNSIVRNFMERKWAPSELGGGKFCEIVFTILEGHAQGTYATAPKKPPNFVAACRSLEGYTNVPRSFQILIPRILPALYEIRNNRGVGHVGGDVDPNHMDATAVLSMTSWVMAELVRVFHSLPTEEAREVVDALVERRIPLVWQSGSMKRVLDPKLPLKDQILLLLSSAPAEVSVDDLITWTGYKKRAYFIRLLRKLHDSRLVELGNEGVSVLILPPGAEIVQKIIEARK